MASTVPFKIYLEEADGSIEIRRFCVDWHAFMSGQLSFDEVRDKICKLYPSLLDRQFTIHWKDDEGDKIAVNCDDEFNIAITTIKKSWMRDMTVRLYVILDNIQLETSTEEEGTAAKVIRYTPEELKSINTPHRIVNNDSDSSSSSSEEEAAAIGDASPNLGQPRPTSALFSPGSLGGLACHLCQCSLDGRLLYKCVTCPNYNLCANCVTHAHYEHAMLRIPSQQALSRSGIFVVDRLNDLARRQSVTSRFDFSALILPIADNYEASPFRKMRDAVEVKTATKSGGGSASSTASVSRKMTRVSPWLPGCDASPVGVSYRPTVSDGGEGTAKGKEEQKEKEKKCKKEKKEEKKREKKERKEKKLKRSRSCRVERDDFDMDFQLFDEIINSLIDARPSLRDRQSGYGISTQLINQILNRMSDVQPGSRCVDVASGIVSDLLSSLNISCPSGASSASQTKESQPKGETRKRKVCDSTSHASKVAADNSGAAKVAVDNTGAVKVADDNSGAAKVAVDNSGAVKVAADNSGAAKVAVDNTGAVKVADVNSSSAKVADVNSSAAKVAGNNSLLAENPFPTLTQVRFEDDGIRVTAVPEEKLEEVVTSCSSPSADELDWMFVGPTSTGAIPKQTSSSVYPSPSQIPQMEPTVAPPPPQPPVTAAQGQGQKAPLTEKQERVHSALNKMLAMGFSNEGGWLENILDQQDASIERVLEMLLPPSVVGRVVD